MSAWTPARARRLDELAGPDGVIVGAAADQGYEDADVPVTSRPLLERLGAVGRELATPWRERVGPISAPPPGELP